MLKQFLTNKVDNLDGLVNRERIKDLLNRSIHVKLRDLWISLYEAIVKRTLNAEQIAIILSYYAHRGEEIQPILALQAIAKKHLEFERLLPPNYNSFQISAGSFRSKEVRDLLRAHYKQPAEYESEEWLITRRRFFHDTSLNTIMDDISTTIKESWPCNSVTFTNRWNNFTCIDFVAANNSVNEKLKVWYANHQLNHFITEVENRLSSLIQQSHGRIRVPPCHVLDPIPKHWPQTSIDFDRKLLEISRKFQNEIEEARNIWEMGATDSSQSIQYWWKIYQNICNSNEMRHLIQGGIFPRMVPSLLLPKIMDPNFDRDLRCLIGAFAMAIAREQRKNRIAYYSKRPELQAALDREQNNVPHVNWKPYEYPEWLLFEIEQNLTIRRIQIEIAMRMIRPPDATTKHSVMQLNMGEGKTAVVVPILAAKLADGTQTCQIIVLKSLFATNLKSLRQYLGGFLNRRIYIFPCRRDMPIESHAQNILAIYEECQREKGTI